METKAEQVYERYSAIDAQLEPVLPQRHLSLEDLASQAFGVELCGRSCARCWCGREKWTKMRVSA